MSYKVYTGILMVMGRGWEVVTILSQYTLLWCVSTIFAYDNNSIRNIFRSQDVWWPIILHHASRSVLSPVFRPWDILLSSLMLISNTFNISLYFMKIFHYISWKELKSWNKIMPVIGGLYWIGIIYFYSDLVNSLSSSPC